MKIDNTWEYLIESSSERASYYNWALMNGWEAWISNFQYCIQWHPKWQTYENHGYQVRAFCEC